MDATDFKTIRKFSGVNNVDEKTRLVPIVIDREYAYQLSQANNVEIDNTYRIKSRSGYTSVLTGTNLHSLWSDGVKCFFADGTTLYQMEKDYTKISIKTNLPTEDRLSFVTINDRVYYSNLNVIGYIKKYTDYSIIDPDLEFKEPMPSGQHIEYFMGCLLIAKNNILYISDPLCDYYDARYGYKQFLNNIRMVRAVDTGLFVSDDKIWFVSGKGWDEFDRREVYPSAAIPFTDLRIPADYLITDKDGNVAIWTSENGICIGDNSGNVTNHTDFRYTFTMTANGAALVRDKTNQRHYINTLY